MASISLQDLRRKIYLKAKADKAHRFWGMYVHICKRETLEQAYLMAKRNNGAPGIDGVTFEAIVDGREKLLEQIRNELTQGTYVPTRNRKVEIPKGNGKTRTLGIPTIRDRVVQGAVKLLLEPIFEADFQDGSYGYRPKRTAQQAVKRVEVAVAYNKTQVIDVDLKSYFDNIRHVILLRKVAERINDDKVMRLLKLILKAAGKHGIPQGGPLSPILSNIYLNDVIKMLEKMKRKTTFKTYSNIEYAHYADDIVILTNGLERWRWLLPRVHKQLMEELAKIDIQINKEKTRLVDMTKGETFGFLGFNFMRRRTRKGKWGVRLTPRAKARAALLSKIKEVFRAYKSQPIGKVIELINPILRGWVNYFRIGCASRCLYYVKEWVEKKIRRHMARARKWRGFGWSQWSTQWMYQTLGLYNDYQVRRHHSES